MQKAILRHFLVMTGLLGFLLPVSGQQRTDEDPIETALRQKRREIKFLADLRDYEGIKAIKVKLKTEFDSTKQLALIDEEAFVINYMVRDYRDILKKVKSWPKSFNVSSYELMYPPEDGLFEHLLDVATLDSTRLIGQISEPGLKPYEQGFLELYFRALLSTNSSSSISREELARMGQAYLDKYAPSPFDSFVKLKIRRKYVKNNWGATLGLGAARGTYQGDFGNLLRFNVPVLIDLELNYKPFVAGLRLSGGEGTIRRDFEYEGFWDRGLKVNPFYGGLYVGYMLDLDPIRISPYYDLGWTFISVAERDLTMDNEDFEIAGFTHGPGLSLDFIPPFSWSGLDNEIYRLGFRFKGGVLFNSLKNKDPMFDSHYPYLGIELILDFVETELDLN